MIALVDSIGPVIWRASWQAAVVAIVVCLVLRCLGERLAPRWRFMLWGVVVARLLLVATPATPWSIFNLMPSHSEMTVRAVAVRDSDKASGPLDMPFSATATVINEKTGESSQRAVVQPQSALAPPLSAPGPAATPPSAAPMAEAPTRAGSVFERISIVRIFTSCWLAGCVFLAIRLLGSALVLQRRIAACRRVNEGSVLELLETLRCRMGLRRAPAVIVTPESLSPCIVGTWNPRIVLPESAVTGTSTARLRHILAHELAHVVRGDLLTNWLLLVARTLHWFNPIAWWTVREMQGEREAACDELAFLALGEAERPAYAATIVELAASLSPSGLAPGLVGLFASPCRLKARVARLVRYPQVRLVGWPVAASVLLAVALIGLTDATQSAHGQPMEKVTPDAPDRIDAKPHTVSGRCVDADDRAPIAGVTVRLYGIDGRTTPPVEIATTVTNADGNYQFRGLEPPRPFGHRDRLQYAVFGFKEGRPIGVSFFHHRDGKEVVELRMARKAAALSGKVIDADGLPVAGATVLPYFVYDRPVPGLLAATTNGEGRFRIENLGVFQWPGGKHVPTSFNVLHPDYPETRATANALPAEVVVTLEAGCIVTGSITDGVTGQPAAGAVITARREDRWGEAFASSDAGGRFRMVLPEGRYDFLVDAKDRVCVAMTGRECMAGEKLELQAFKLIAGGFISGRVVNTATGEPVAVTENGEPVMLGLFGPSQPAGRVISQIPLATVDREGRFTMRAAPGENFPYLVNMHGGRMAWDTREQPPVVVREGETTAYGMLITPPVSTETKLQAAGELVKNLSEKPSERMAQILLEFRKLNETVDETETWCLLMRELVSIGPDAVPQLCAELDRTTENRMLRRLGFALRAIGDVRAVPALIRAIPKTLLESGSDYGLLVGDQKLTAFMQMHDLDTPNRGSYFSFGRPVREVFGALHHLTRQEFNDTELFYMSLSEDPRRQVLQRRIFARQARRWQTWWEANWQEFTDDAAYRQVDLQLIDEQMPAGTAALRNEARLSGVMSGAVVSPASEKGQYASHFLDLDTGYRTNWPAEIPLTKPSGASKELVDWANENGIDLMCITHRAPDGTETYILRALGMNVQEITERDLRNLRNSLAAGRLPSGRPVGGLLMHYDATSQQLVPDANGAFLFITREGNRGVIEVTDRVTRTSGLAGTPAGDPLPGVGFRKGVRFDLSEIIP